MYILQIKAHKCILRLPLSQNIFLEVRCFFLNSHSFSWIYSGRFGCVVELGIVWDSAKMNLVKDTELVSVLWKPSSFRYSSLQKWQLHLKCLSTTQYLKSFNFQLCKRKIQTKSLKHRCCQAYCVWFGVQAQHHYHFLAAEALHC